MNIKSIIFASFGLASICLALPAYADDCQKHLQSGGKYGSWHQGPDLAFMGRVKIEQTYNCPQGTCFSAKMSFENYNNNRDVATGFWSGSNFELKRYVAAGNNTQVWSGTCMPNSVKGNWYIENEKSNNGAFSITY
jgi:hypothetical protein